MSFNVAEQSPDLNVDDMVFLYSLHSDVSLAAKKTRCEFQDAVKKCRATCLEEKFGGVWHCLNLSSKIILESGCGNDYRPVKSHASRVRHTHLGSSTHSHARMTF